MFGGETPAYSDLLDEASAGSTYKLMREAQGLGATDVVNVRYQTTSTMNRLIFGLHVSVMGYGTVCMFVGPAALLHNLLALLSCHAMRDVKHVRDKCVWVVFARLS